jgi:N-acetylneuraminate synthase/sialic acid synthase
MLGARVFEKHFTLNRAAKGSDHAFSLEPAGLKRVVRDLSRARVALGNGVKAPYESERKPLNKMVKRMVAARDLPAGHVLTVADIAFRIPAEARITDNALPPYWIDRFVGKRLVTAVKADDIVGFREVGATDARQLTADETIHV